MNDPRRRALLVVAGVALLSLVGGFGLSLVIVSPREAAARSEAPEASAITVAVEERLLTSEVVTRGNAVFDGARDLTVEVTGLTSPPVVTGRIPAVGDTLDEGDVAFEITGRPVLMLGGNLPTYRDLGPGLSGPDVAQLEEALERLGYDVGDPGDIYDAGTARAVAALYADAGYPAPEAPEDTVMALEAARDAVEAATEEGRAARTALDQARRGPAKSERMAMDGAVTSARRAVEDAVAARSELEAADPPAPAAERRAARTAVEEARANLKMAEVQRDELLAPPDVSEMTAGVDAADKRLARARSELAELEAASATPLPAAEVLFVPSLPRRVDAVGVEQGVALEGVALSVSGAELVIAAEIADRDLELVEVGLPVTLTSDDLELTGTIEELREGDGEGEGAGGTVAIIAPDDLDADTIEALRGANLRVAIPVGSTDGEALVVPVAALTAGAGEDSRVEVQGEGGETELVPVEVLLAADGYAAVASDALAVGDLVVVGR